MPGRVGVTVGMRKLLAKTCLMCQKLKNADEFPKVKRPSGQYYNSECTDCVTKRAMKIHRNKNTKSMDTAYNNHEPWLEIDIQTLERYIKAGLTHEAIGKKMGRTIAAIKMASSKYLKEN